MLLVLTLALTVSLHAADHRIDVPHVPQSPKIDGRFSAKEWAQALRVRIGDNGHAFLQHNNRYLFIAISARRPGVASLCTTSKKNDVRVLHASAAIGTAEWKQEDAKWTLTRGFAFDLRDTGESVAAQTARKQFLGAEGWFANADPAGALYREYQIRLDGRSEIPLTIGFLSFVKRNQFEYDYWPETIADGCAERDLAGGASDLEYTFEPKTWGVAVMQ